MTGVLQLGKVDVASHSFLQYDVCGMHCRCFWMQCRSSLDSHVETSGPTIKYCTASCRGSVVRVVLCRGRNSQTTNVRVGKKVRASSSQPIKFSQRQGPGPNTEPSRREHPLNSATKVPLKGAPKQPKLRSSLRMRLTVHASHPYK